MMDLGKIEPSHNPRSRRLFSPIYLDILCCANTDKLSECPGGRVGVDFIVSVYSTDLSDGAGEGNRQGRSMFIMMANCLLRCWSVLPLSVLIKETIRVCVRSVSS